VDNTITDHIIAIVDK